MVWSFPEHDRSWDVSVGLAVARISTTVNYLFNSPSKAMSISTILAGSKRGFPS
jgi:hypothetical protein